MKLAEKLKTEFFVTGNCLTLFIAMPLTRFAVLLGFSSYHVLFANLVPQAQRGKITGSMNFFTYIFMALGGALGEFLYDNVSPQSSVLLTIILVIPSTLIALIYIREPKPEERQA